MGKGGADREGDHCDASGSRMIDPCWLCLVWFKLPGKARRTSGEDIALEVRGVQRDMGRGTQNLRKALSSFSIQVQNKVCVDVGSCSGSFTQVLLEQGASPVYAIDSAVHQRIGDEFWDTTETQNDRGQSGQ